MKIRKMLTQGEEGIKAGYMKFSGKVLSIDLSGGYNNAPLIMISWFEHLYSMYFPTHVHYIAHIKRLYNRGNILKFC